MDVEARRKEIVRWEALSAQNRAKTPCPPPLEIDETFTKKAPVPPKSIFWTKGLKTNSDGTVVGDGMLSLELVGLDLLGFDLSRNTFAMNETLRIAIRTILPFLVLILVSRLTAPDDKNRLDRFFAKMATVVQEDREADARELELSYAQPDRFDHRKLFPRSDWMFYRWNRVDLIGFVLAVLCAFAVLGFLKLLLTIGA
jgi:SSS family solute:Na+ symporter